jgi:hypothetical protein
MTKLDDYLDAMSSPPDFAPQPLDLGSVIALGSRIRRRRRLATGAASGLAVMTLLIGGALLVRHPATDTPATNTSTIQPSTTAPLTTAPLTTAPPATDEPPATTPPATTPPATTPPATTAHRRLPPTPPPATPPPGSRR